MELRFAIKNKKESVIKKETAKKTTLNSNM